MTKGLPELIHKIFHEFAGTTCRTDGGWCDARDHADAVLAALREASRPQLTENDIELLLTGVQMLEIDSQREEELTEKVERLGEASRLASPPATTKGPNVEEKAWLVELGCSPPQWWTGRPKNGFNFSPDANRAMRFARREDAEGAIGHLIHRDAAHGCKATEHIWLAASPPETAPALDVIAAAKAILEMYGPSDEYSWGAQIAWRNLEIAFEKLAAHGSRPAGRPDRDDWTVSDRDQRLGLTHLDQP